MTADTQATDTSAASDYDSPLIKGAIYGPPRDARGKSLISRRKRCSHISGIDSGMRVIPVP